MEDWGPQSRAANNLSSLLHNEPNECSELSRQSLDCASHDRVYLQFGAFGKNKFPYGAKCNFLRDRCRWRLFWTSHFLFESSINSCGINWNLPLNMKFLRECSVCRFAFFCPSFVYGNEILVNFNSVSSNRTLWKGKELNIFKLHCC